MFDEEDEYYESDESSRTSSTNSSIISPNNLDWADGVIILYDIGNHGSFEYATEKLYEIHDRMNQMQCKNLNQRLSKRRSSDKGLVKPVLLIGNKTDLMWRRAVTSADVHQATKNYPSLINYTELSVADSFDDVKRCVDELITVIKSSKKSQASIAPSRENLKKFLTEKFSTKHRNSDLPARASRNTMRRVSVY